MVARLQAAVAEVALLRGGAAPAWLALLAASLAGAAALVVSSSWLLPTLSVGAAGRAVTAAVDLGAGADAGGGMGAAAGAEARRRRSRSRVGRRWRRRRR